MTNRRAFLLGASAALAAPAIVRAESLMKLWVPRHELYAYSPPSQPLIEALAALQEAKTDIVRSFAMGAWTRTSYDAVLGCVVTETVRPDELRALV